MTKEILQMARGEPIDIQEAFATISLEKKKHSYAVAQTASFLWKCVQKTDSSLCEEYTTKEVEEAALYHDIGFVLIPQRIQEKEEELTHAEYRVVQKHTIYGASLLDRFRTQQEQTEQQERLWEISQEVALSHHEFWNGKGYPNGLRTTAISLPARVVAIADAYDTMVRASPYRMALPPEYALLEIMSGAGKQFDPDLAEIFKVHYEEMITLFKVI